jgi:uncharacterized protein (DUF4415 family)
MKKAISKPLTKRALSALKALERMDDRNIDTRDVPEARDWKGAKRGVFYRPVKPQLTLRLDADVVDWFRRQGEGYQTRINAVLRKHVSRKAG